MSSRKISFGLIALFFLALAVGAQQTPGDLGDLVGIRASNGERELNNR